MPLHLQRQRQIVEILTRNGFGLLVSMSGLGTSGFGRRVVTALTPEEDGVDEAFRNPIIVRKTLEELGPTFIKAGQILSTRADLLSPEYMAELSKLRTDVPPEPFESIRETLETELKRPITEVYKEFDETPIGSASIGQTHAAVMPDGREVVVKVQRAHAQEQLTVDIDIMKAVARELTRRWSVARRVDLVGFVAEFEHQIAGEIDYAAEASNAERIAANFAKRPGLHVPYIVHEASTNKVLTMERLYGITIDDVAALDAAGIDRKALGHNAATAILDMVLVDGFFHGDPHPGNLLVGPDGTIEVLDFGMVGTLSDESRRYLVRLVVAFASKNAEHLADALLDLAPPSGDVNRALLVRDSAELIAHYEDKPLADVPIIEVLNKLLSILRSQHLQPQPEFAMVAKMIGMVDGLGRVLDPNFDMMGLLRPYGTKLLFQRLDPEHLARAAASLASEASMMGTDLPARAHRLLRRFERDGVRIYLDDNSLQPALRRMDALGDRLVAGMLLAAFINSIGNLASTDQRWLSKARGPLLITGTIAAGGLTGFLTDSLRRRK